VELEKYITDSGDIGIRLLGLTRVQMACFPLILKEKGIEDPYSYKIVKRHQHPTRLIDGGEI